MAAVARNVCSSARTAEKNVKSASTEVSAANAVFALTVWAERATTVTTVTNV